MKNILITGANKGIGFETARQLAELGYFVYIGSRDAQNGADAVARLNADGLTSVDYLVLDIADPDSVEQARAVLETKIDMLDVLINNAGISGQQPQTFAEGDIANLRRLFDTNFFGTVQTTQQFLPLLTKSAQPIIINVSSELGSLALNISEGQRADWILYNAYAATKVALNAFTIMLANELRDTPFRVNSVTPGYTATDLNQYQGTRTVAEGAKPIVQLVAQADTKGTARFYQDGGDVPW
jgi:NAD(P)-dependent dehydrogenase (short-subunit alcohol dehydrogenase family)